MSSERKVSNILGLGCGYLAGRLIEKIMVHWIKAWSYLKFVLKCTVWRIHYGRDIEIFGPVSMRAYRNGIQIGNHVQIVASSGWWNYAAPIYHPVILKTFMPSARIVIEDNVVLNGTSITCRSSTIRIRQNTMIGANSIIMDSDYHHAWPIE